MKNQLTEDEKRIQELEMIKTTLYDCTATYPAGLMRRIGNDIESAVEHLNVCIVEIEGRL